MSDSNLDIHIPNDRGRLYTVITYPAGEIQTRLTDEGLLALVKADSYRIVANPIPDVIELAQLNNAILTVFPNFTNRVLFLPYMPFSRADRRFAKGDTFALQVYIQLLATMGFNKIQTFDIHSAVTEALVNGTQVMSFENIDPMLDILNVLYHIGDGDLTHLAIVLPDKGSIHRYKLDEWHIPVLQGDKVRDPLTGKLSGFTIDPRITEYRKALIVDDICDGGGTFIGLGQTIKRANPDIDLYLYTSHGIYSQGEEKLKTVFKELFNAANGFNNRKPKEVLGFLG